MRPGQQGGLREEGVERGPGRPPSPHLPAPGPGPRALTCPASQMLQQFPVPGPHDCAESELAQEAERCRFSSRNLCVYIYIYIYIYIFFFFKPANLEKLGTSPANFSF